MKSILELHIKNNGKIEVFGNSEGLYRLHEVFYEAVASRRGLARSRDGKWKVVRLPRKEEVEKGR